MNYLELQRNPDHRVPLQYGCWFRHTDPGFMHFYPMSDDLNKGINRNWKARISVHPQALHQAWDIIFPLLLDHDFPFKVAKDEAMLSKIQKQFQRLIQHQKDYELFLHLGSREPASWLQSFRKMYQKLAASRYSSWTLIAKLQSILTRLKCFYLQCTLKPKDLLTFTQRLYSRLIELDEQKLKNYFRLHEGMQFTIYIAPGREAACQRMLEAIEQELLDANIEPGIVYPTDRKIGIYSSIRHPGRWWYHNAYEVENYNTDDVQDPFTFLSTHPEPLLQDETLDKSKHSAEAIISLLQTDVLIAPAQFKTLAIHKELVLDSIHRAPLKLKQLLLNQSLDKATNLGRFFRVQRGFLRPRAHQGTLRVLQEIQQKERLC